MVMRLIHVSCNLDWHKYMFRFVYINNSADPGMVNASQLFRPPPSTLLGILGNPKSPGTVLEVRIELPERRD